MNKGKTRDFLYTLFELAEVYVDDCLKNTRVHVASSGKEVELMDRHIPTVDYFLRIWIPRNYSKSDTIKRSSYYRWLRWNNNEKQRVVTDIQDTFKALAKDIVANEGKGIFYAKNALGMHDKQHIEQKQVDKFDFDN